MSVMGIFQQFSVSSGIMALLDGDETFQHVGRGHSSSNIPWKFVFLNQLLETLTEPSRTPTAENGGPYGTARLVVGRT